MSDTATKVGKGLNMQSSPLSEELIRTLAEVFRIFANRGRQVLAETRACSVDEVNTPNEEQGATSAALNQTHTCVALARNQPREGSR